MKFPNEKITDQSSTIELSHQANCQPLLDSGYQLKDMDNSLFNYETMGDVDLETHEEHKKRSNSENSQLYNSKERKFADSNGVNPEKIIEEDNESLNEEQKARLDHPERAHKQGYTLLASQQQAENKGTQQLKRF